MRLMMFDTETNGLPSDFHGAPSRDHIWPHVVEIAWTLVEATERNEWKVQDSQSHLIVPREGVIWSAEAEKLHGISQERAAQEGISILDAITRFQAALVSSDVVLAHNLDFDRNVVDAEAYRIDIRMRWCKYSFCTARNTTELVAIPSQYPRYGPWKTPKLVELYNFLLPEEGAFAAHTAAGDVEALAKCADKLNRAGYFDEFRAGIAC
jgi:DNA polymerase III epsilon subunit-like protein